MPSHPFRRPHRLNSRPASAARWLLVALPSVTLFGFGLTQAAEGQPRPAPPAAYAQQARPLIQQYCAGCHGASSPKAGVNLMAYADATAIQRDQTTWRKVLTQLRERAMPPRGAA